MTPIARIITFRVENDILEGMEELKARDGIPFSEQLRRAMRMWLETKGVTKAERKRAVTRKRP